MVALGYEKYGSQAEFNEDLFSVYVQVTQDAKVDPNVKVEAASEWKRDVRMRFNNGANVGRRA
jgi:hypothetical protein